MMIQWLNLAKPVNFVPPTILCRSLLACALRPYFFWNPSQPVSIKPIAESRPKMEGTKIEAVSLAGLLKKTGVVRPAVGVEDTS